MKNLIDLFEAQSRPESVTLDPLPYAQDALEPVMSRETVRYHYSKLSRAYVDRYNAGEGDPEFNLGGAQFHNLWWPQLQAPQRGANRPAGKIAELIDRSFGSFEEFQDQFTDTAMGLQGSGWCCLTNTGKIVTVPNQSFRRGLILVVDMWEHSWAVGVKNPDKKKYLESIWKIINWTVINHRIESQ